MCGSREIAIGFEMRMWIRVMVTEVEKKEEQLSETIWGKDDKTLRLTRYQGQKGKKTKEEAKTWRPGRQLVPRPQTGPQEGKGGSGRKTQRSVRDDVHWGRGQGMRVDMSC